jgi:hypothetical protein
VNTSCRTLLSRFIYNSINICNVELSYAGAGDVRYPAAPLDRPPHVGRQLTRRAGAHYYPHAVHIHILILILIISIIIIIIIIIIDY